MATFPEDGVIGVPADLVMFRRGRDVDADLDLSMVLQLLDLRQTLSISVLVEHHWTLNTQTSYEIWGGVTGVSWGGHLPFGQRALFIYLKSTWQRAGSATYMSHSQQRHAYKSNTHKIIRNLETIYNNN